MEIYAAALLSLLSAKVPAARLLRLLSDLINPPPTVPKYSIYLRRQASQEEFFPRPLKTNPITYSHIQSSPKNEVRVAVDEGGSRFG